MPRGEDDDILGEESVGGGGVNESFESAQGEDDNRNTDAAVASGNLPPPPPPVVPSALAPHHHKVQDTGDIEGLTTAPSMPAFSAPVDVRGALKRVASSVKAQKTKNAFNKNKERTLLAGAIVKLLEKNQSPSDGMATNMSMMLMKQMEVIHKSMDNVLAERGKTRGWRGSRGKRRGQRRQPSKGRWIMEARPGEGAAAIVVAAATSTSSA